MAEEDGRRGVRRQAVVRRRMQFLDNGAILQSPPMNKDVNDRTVFMIDVMSDDSSHLIFFPTKMRKLKMRRYKNWGGHFRIKFPRAMEIRWSRSGKDRVVRP
jgi:hypothetical protein